MQNRLFGTDIISIADLGVDEIQLILDTARSIKAKPQPTLLQGKVLGSCFFEASTRTRLSFEAAIHRLGGQFIGFADGGNTSAGKKGETLSDTIRVMSDYVDGIIIRHPNSGSARLAAEVSGKPIVNAGDGGNQHPTQTLLDLFTIQECQGRLQDLHIGMAGDLKYGRTVHSLAQALSHFNARLYFISPESLSMPDYVCNYLRKKGVQFSFHQDLAEVMPKLDVMYMTRMQKERFDPTEYEQVKQQFVIDPTVVESGKKNLKVLHPLPRVGEITAEVDTMPQAYYFQQAANGVPVRQALLALLLNKEVCL